MFSPIRIGMVSAVAGLVRQERAIYGEIAPLGVAIVAMLMGAALIASP